jgi:hypothetical protein
VRADWLVAPVWLEVRQVVVAAVAAKALPC